MRTLVWISTRFVVDRAGRAHTVGFANREFGGRPGVSIAHESGDVTIYAVDADAACESTTISCPAD